MVLTVYDSFTYPYPSFPSSITQDIGITGVTSAAVTSDVSDNPVPYINTNDHLVLFVTWWNSTTATVSSVAIPNVSGLAWTRIANVVGANSKSEIWIAKYTGAIVTNAGSWTITVSASSNFAYIGAVVSGAASYDATVSTVNGTGTTTSTLTHTSNTKQNSLALLYEARSATSLATMTAPTVDQFPNNEIGVASTAQALSGGVQQVINTLRMFPGLAKATPEQTKYTYNISNQWYLASVVFYGPTVSLDDYTFMLDDTGPLLNDPTNTLPLYDVDNVTGLDEVNASSDTSDVDGADGSYVQGRYASGKTIVVEGTLLVPTPADEATFDTFKASVDPVTDPVPFHFKLPNQNPRYLRVFPLSGKVDLARARSYGNAPFQIQAQSPDAVAFERAQSVTAVAEGISGLNRWIATIDLGGNAYNYPDIYFRMDVSDLGVDNAITITNPVWDNFRGKVLKSNAYFNQIGTYYLGIGNGVSGITVTPGVYKLSLANRSLIRLSASGDVNTGALITTSGWFPLLPGVRNIIRMSRQVASTNPRQAFTVVYRNAWR